MINFKLSNLKVKWPPVKELGEPEALNNFSIFEFPSDLEIFESF